MVQWAVNSIGKADCSISVIKTEFPTRNVYALGTKSMTGFMQTQKVIFFIQNQFGLNARSMNLSLASITQCISIYDKYPRGQYF